MKGNQSLTESFSIQLSAQSIRLPWVIGAFVWWEFDCNSRRFSTGAIRNANTTINLRWFIHLTSDKNSQLRSVYQKELHVAHVESVTACSDKSQALQSAKYAQLLVTHYSGNHGDRDFRAWKGSHSNFQHWWRQHSCFIKLHVLLQWKLRRKRVCILVSSYMNDVMQSFLYISCAVEPSAPHASVKPQRRL